MQSWVWPLAFQVYYALLSLSLHHLRTTLPSSAVKSGGIIWNKVVFSKEANSLWKDSQLSSTWTVAVLVFIGSALAIVKIVDHNKEYLGIEITVFMSFSPPTLLMNANRESERENWEVWDSLQVIRSLFRLYYLEPYFVLVKHWKEG